MTLTPLGKDAQFGLQCEDMMTLPQKILHSGYLEWSKLQSVCELWVLFLQVVLSLPLDSFPIQSLGC